MFRHNQGLVTAAEAMGFANLPKYQAELCTPVCALGRREQAPVPWAHTEKTNPPATEIKQGKINPGYL